MNAKVVLVLSLTGLAMALASCTPPGMVAAFHRVECPRGWVEADGQHYKLDLRGRTVFGVGPYPQGGGTVLLGSAEGSHKMRVSVLENENAPRKGDKSIEGVRVEWQDEGRTESRAVEDTGMWRPGLWTDHFPPYVGLLYCVKQ